VLLDRNTVRWFKLSSTGEAHRFRSLRWRTGRSRTCPAPPCGAPRLPFCMPLFDIYDIPLVGRSGAPARKNACQIDRRWSRFSGHRVIPGCRRVTSSCAPALIRSSIGHSSCTATTNGHFAYIRQYPDGRHVADSFLRGISCQHCDILRGESTSAAMSLGPRANSSRTCLCFGVIA
jgi:hypothetical protein